MNENSTDVDLSLSILQLSGAFSCNPKKMEHHLPMNQFTSPDLFRLLIAMCVHFGSIIRKFIDLRSVVLVCVGWKKKSSRRGGDNVVVGITKLNLFCNFINFSCIGLKLIKPSSIINKLTHTPLICSP